MSTNADTILPEDIEQAAHYETLGPAYFAARRMAEALMAGTVAEPFQAVIKRVVDEIQREVYDYADGHLLSDLEANIHEHVRRMVERTVQALLTGEPWAIRQYALAQRHDAEAVRAAVAKHGGDALLMARIADLEKENARLSEDLRFYRDR